MTTRCKTAILISGSGTNLQAFIDRVGCGALNLELSVVFSNKPDAFGLVRARNAGIPTACIEHSEFADRDSFDHAVAAKLDEWQPDLLVLAGFMRIISEVFLEAFPQRIINIHPALLPAFPGLHVQKKALEYGARFSGCTVHFVDAGVDTGPIIIQAVVPILDDDTEESLSARILQQEHQIYPKAIQLLAEDRVKIQDRRVLIDSKETPETALTNPPI